MNTSRQKKNGVFTVSAMMLAAVFSKLLGMLRQVLFASRFADSAEATAFTAAFSVPLALFDVLFGAAIAGCFIPAFAEAKKESDARSVRFASSFLFSVFLATAVLASLGIAFSEKLISLIAPALSPETALLAARLLRIMMSAVVFAGIVFTLTGLYQSLERFLLPAAVSSVSNLLLIVYLAFFVNEVSEKSVTGLAWVYLVSWGVQALVLAVPSLLLRFFPLSVPTFGNPDLKKAVSRAPLILIGSWLLPFSSLIATYFASYLSDSAVVLYQYAYNLFVIAVGVLTYGICNFIFPKLSSASEAEDSSFSDCMTKALYNTERLLLFFAAAFGILARPITALLYVRGNFTFSLAEETASLIPFFALAMPFYGASEVLTRAFLAGKKPAPVAAASLSGVLCCVLSDVLLITFAGRNLKWLALSFLSAEILAFLILYASARRTGLLKRPAGRIVFLPVPALFAGVAMVLARAMLFGGAVPDSFFGKFFLLGLVFLIGSVVYLGCTCMLGFFSSERK